MSDILFFGHSDARQRAAIIYSIVVSCQRRKIELLAYLRDVLARPPSDDYQGKPGRHYPR